MGLIKGGLFVFCATMLLFSLVAMNLSMTLFYSTSLDNIKSEAVSNADAINEETGILDHLEDNEETIRSHCENNADYVFSHNKYAAELSCEDVRDDFSKAKEAAIGKSVESIYYEDYQCDFMSCVIGLENPLYMVSEQSHEYWESKFYFLAFLSIALAGLVLFFADKKTTAMIVIGAIFMVSSLPFFKINLLIPSGEGLLAFALNVISSSAVYVALVIFILGVFALSFGIGMKFWHLGNFFSERFKIKSEK